MEKAIRYMARFGFGYCGRTLDQGQVVSLQGAPNDYKLVQLGHFAAVDPHGTTYPCSQCGAEFISASALALHVKQRHAGQQEPIEQGERR